MYNKQRGVKTTEQNCKIGKVTKVEVEYSLDEAFNHPIKQLDNLFKSFGEIYKKDGI